VEAGPLTSHKYLRFILDVLSPTTITVLFLAHAASSQSLLSGPVDSSCHLPPISDFRVGPASRHDARSTDAQSAGAGSSEYGCHRLACGSDSLTLR
jgi:hypothetical protein